MPLPKIECVNKPPSKIKSNTRFRWNWNKITNLMEWKRTLLVKNAYWIIDRIALHPGCMYIGTQHTYTEMVHLVFQYPHSVQDWFSLAHFTCTLVGGAYACPVLSTLAHPTRRPWKGARTQTSGCVLYVVCLCGKGDGNGVSRAPPEWCRFHLHPGRPYTCICVQLELDFQFDFRRIFASIRWEA